MAHRTQILYVTAAVLVFFQSTDAISASWDFGYRNISQIRKGPNRTNEFPINQYVGIGLSQLPRNFSFETNFRAFADPKMDRKAFDLYEAAFHVEPVSSFSLDGGRQWLSDGFDATILDGTRLGFFPSDGHLGGSIYAGIPRYLEDGNFHNVTEGLVIGGALNLLNVKDTSAGFSVRWRKIDATRNDYRHNDTIYLGLAGSHQFTSSSWAPNIYGNAEIDTAGKTLDVGTLGLNFYPHWRVAFTIEGSRFDVARRSADETILGNFFSGSIAQGREGLQIKIAKDLNFIQDFSFQYYKVPGRGAENGYTAGAGLGHFWEKAKLSSEGEYYYRKSFGGHVHGGYVALANKYFKHVFANVSFDISRYSKVTGQRDTAISLVGDVGYAFTGRTRLAVGGEFNHNNWFDKEGRITLGLEIGLDTSGYTPEKRSKKINRRFHEI